MALIGSPVYLDLGSAPTSRVARRNAVLVASLFLAGACLIGVAADQPRAAIHSFVPMAGVAIVLLDALTAYILTIQFFNSRQLNVALVASGYGFVAPVACLQVLIFPGAVSDLELFSGASQAAAWLWTIWNCVFPLVVIAAMIAQWSSRGRPLAPAAYRLTLSSTLLVPLVLALLAGLVAVALSRRSLPLVTGANYDQVLEAGRGWLVVVVNGLAVLAVLAVGRAKNVLVLWLGVASFVNLLSVAIAFLGGARFSVGWYGSRCLSVAMSMIILAVTLWEVTKLYTRLSVANRRLSDLASHDDLTGLYNRRYFDAALETAMLQAKLSGSSVSLLMLDIDFFKLYNDAFGHGRGDEILIEVGRLLQSTARYESDTVARYGGEEFVLLLPGASLQQVAGIAERIASDLAGLRIPAPATPLGLPYLTVSGGIVHWSAALAFSPQELVAAADKALYESKNAGRNTTTIARELQRGLDDAKFGEKLLVL